MLWWIQWRWHPSTLRGGIEVTTRIQIQPCLWPGKWRRKKFSTVDRRIFNPDMPVSVLSSMLVSICFPMFGAAVVKPLQCTTGVVCLLGLISTLFMNILMTWKILMKKLPRVHWCKMAGRLDSRLPVRLKLNCEPTGTPLKVNISSEHLISTPSSKQVSLSR